MKGTRKPAEVEDPAPVFVLGCPRSGTTLLGGLLQDTRWGGAVETQFILKYAQVGSRLDLAERRQFAKLINKITSERAVRQWDIQWDVAELYESLTAHNYAETVNAICLRRAWKRGYEGWADKTPHYCDTLERIETLRELFPKAKFVLVVRDGRDVAHSLLQKPWGPNNIWKCAQYWRTCCESLLGANDKFGDVCHFIHFEQLLAKPLDELIPLFHFLGQPDAEQTAVNCANKVDGARTGRWQQRLSATQIQHFEAGAGEMLDRLGYERATSPRELAKPIQLAYRVHDRAKWIKFMFDQNVIDGIKIKFFGKQPFAE